MIQVRLVLLLSFLQICRADDQPESPHQYFLRKRQHDNLRETDFPATIDESTIIPPPPRRDLTMIDECRKSTEMDISLVPANMKFLLHNNGLTENNKGLGLATRQQPTPSSARLTFCLNRIYLDFSYILDAGTLITDLDIECPHVPTPVHFLEPNYVMPVAQNSKSRFFVNGSYPGEVSVPNEDILRILADGEDCEFKVRAYNFDDGLLIGQLKGDAFQPVN
jgi:hypothetical protein